MALILYLSFRLPETMECFAKKLESVYNASGGKKINIISHSMGGLLVKCFMSLHSDVIIPPFLWVAILFFPFSLLWVRCCGLSYYVLMVFLLPSGPYLLFFFPFNGRFLRSMWKLGLPLLHLSVVRLLCNLATAMDSLSECDNLHLPSNFCGQVLTLPY